MSFLYTADRDRYREQQGYGQTEGGKRAMRENEKHLVGIPLARLSRLSTLVTELRGDNLELQKYGTYSHFAEALRAFRYATIVEDNNKAYHELCCSIADLIMEVVYPE